MDGNGPWQFPYLGMNRPEDIPFWVTLCIQFPATLLGWEDS